MAKYSTNVEFEIDVPLEIDKRKTFEIFGETFAELKENGRDLQKQIAEEFGVSIEKISLKRDKAERKPFVIF
jgi:hypothetical protein